MVGLEPRAGKLKAALIGLVFGALTGGLLVPAMGGEATAGSTDEELVEVLVARRTVPAGTELGYAVIMRSRMPARFVSASMVRPEHVGQLVGEKILMTLLEGDPILWSHLAVGAPDSICKWIQEANKPRADR